MFCDHDFSDIWVYLTDIVLGGPRPGGYQLRRMSDLIPASLSPAALEAFFHAKIPLTKAMGLRVIGTGPDLIELEAPLEPNLNHLGSVFGGTLHALPTLACYAALWTVLHDGGIDGHVIVKDSAARYRQLVMRPFRAVCPRPSTEAAAEFLEDLRRHKKAVMSLESVVPGDNGKPAVEFSGSFVAVV